jgi:hypothetical protein
MGNLNNALQELREPPSSAKLRARVNDSLALAEVKSVSPYR